MKDQYLIINKKILPDYYQLVIDARNLVHTGTAKNISEAVQMVGISRSTYYKFKDYVFSPSDNNIGKKAVISLQLSHEKGVLSEILNCLASCHTNILTINQSIPINNQASVMISLDVSDVVTDMDHMLALIGAMKGVFQVRLLALE